MAKINFTAREICEIIELSAKSGLSELKFGDIEMRFGKQTENPTKIPAVTEITDDQIKKQNETALVEDELRTKEDQIAQMMIENPAEAEKLIAEGHLDDGDSDRYDDDED